MKLKRRKPVCRLERGMSGHVGPWKLMAGRPLREQCDNCHAIRPVGDLR